MRAGIVVCVVSALLGCSSGDGARPGDSEPDDKNLACTGSGCCTSSHGCLGWQTCDAKGYCVTAPACTSDADCLNGDVCRPNRWCAPPRRFDPADMTVWGDVGIGGVTKGVATLEEPTRIYMGVPNRHYIPTAALALRPTMTPGGEILYIAQEFTTPEAQYTLRQFNEDPWVPGEFGGWGAPEDDLLNDPVIPTPACQTLGDFVVRSGDGEPLYNCYSNSLDWFDRDGNLVVSGWRVLAWNQAGLKLVHRPGEPFLFFLDASGSQIQIGEYEDTLYQLFPQSIVHVRSHGDGFWILARGAPGPAGERWYVSPRGELTREGVYPYQVLDTDRLDGAGALHALFSVPRPGSTGICHQDWRCALHDLGCMLVYDETLGLPSDPEVVDRPMNRIYVGFGPLLTGP